MTSAVVTTVHTAAIALTPEKAQVPGVLWGLFKIIHKIHSLWRWFRWGQVYSNPDNFEKLLAGHVVNFVMGDNILVRVAAQCVLIATKILTCVEQIGNLSQACRNWIDALTGNYDTHTRTEWDKGIETKSSCCSPASLRWWKSLFTGILERIKRIAVTTFEMFKQVFVLSMYFMDAIEAFSLSPSTKNEAISELFVNGTLFLDKMVEQQELLVDCLQENKDTVRNVLFGIGSQYTVEQLIDVSSKGLEAARSVKNVVDYGGGILKDFTKHALFGFFAGLGKASSAPDWCRPDPTPPWEKEGYNSGWTPCGEFPISARTVTNMNNWKNCYDGDCIAVKG